MSHQDGYHLLFEQGFQTGSPDTMCKTIIKEATEVFQFFLPSIMFVYIWCTLLRKSSSWKLIKFSVFMKEAQELLS